MRKTHQTIRKVTESIERDYHFNTAIAALMELMNELLSFVPSNEFDLNVQRFSIKRLVMLISPFAPHLAEELWREIGEDKSIFNANWPVWDEEAAKEEEIELVIQINGKVRSKVMIQAGLDDEAIKEKAFLEPKIQEHLKDKTPNKVIVVKGRLVNLVV
jgi:leucyl-tRNA synthetase